MLLPAQDDTLSYKVLVSKLVPRSDVVVNVWLELMLNANDKGAELDQRIFDALRDFIPVNWELADQERRSATPGFERLKLRAMATVGSDQDWNLQQRAKDANRQGLEFGNVSVKRSLSQDQVNQIVRELWFDAVRKIQEHLPEFEKASGRVWRIGDIALGTPDAGNKVRTSKGGFVDDRDDNLGQLLDSGLAGVEKISLVANVTLKSDRLASVQ